MDLTSMVQKRPLKGRLMNSGAIICVVAVVVFVMTKLGVGMWVPFLALCMWACQGLKCDFKSIISAYVSMGIGLIMGYLVGHAQELGTPALVAFFILVLLLLHCMANQVLTFFFNNYTAVFCTVGTAVSYGAEIIKDWLFAFILFGLTPAVIVYVISKKKAAKAEPDSTAE